MQRLLVYLALTLSICVVSIAQERNPEVTDQFKAQIIPRNSRVYIAPIESPNSKRPLNDFESYLAAALRKKNVPLVMVNDRSQADFEIVGTAESRAPKWEERIFGESRDTISASISVINIKTGVVAYADSSYREAANRGARSSAEKLAKYLKKKIEDDEKKLLRSK
jgi:hypothetical protein